MKLFLIIFTFISFAQQAKERTPSEAQCIAEAQAKNEIIKKSSCKWEVTKQEYPETSENYATCKGYDIIDKKKVARTTTFSGSGHSGTLVCGNADNGAISTSYQNQMPNFAYQCSSCSTSSESTTPDESCIQSMLEQEKLACDGGRPRMQFRYDPNQDPVRVDTKGIIVQ